MLLSKKRELFFRRSVSLVNFPSSIFLRQIFLRNERLNVPPHKERLMKLTFSQRVRRTAYKRELKF